VKTITTRVFPLILCLLLYGCADGGALFFFEAPWAATMGNETRLRAACARTALVHGMIPHFTVVAPGTDPRAALDGTLKAGRFRVAVVGPLASHEWEGFVGSFPGTRFVLVGVPAPDRTLPANATFLGFDTREAFRTAGREAARSVGERPAADPARGCAVLAARDSDLSAAEVEAFRAGAAEVLDGARPAIEELGSAADKSAVRGAIQEMRGRGVEVFLLGLGSLMPAGLESLRDLGGRAVVAGWNGSDECPGQVLLSVEEDVRGGITRAVGAAARGERRVDGGVELVRGGAVPAAPAARAKEE
jgi:hypothetical protein